jgi:hypothetical protein
MHGKVAKKINAEITNIQLNIQVSSTTGIVTAFCRLAERDSANIG